MVLINLATETRAEAWKGLKILLQGKSEAKVGLWRVGLVKIIGLSLLRRTVCIGERRGEEWMDICNEMQLLYKQNY